VASFIGSPAMNLIHGVVAVDDGVVAVSFAEHRIVLAPAAVERYPGLLGRDGTQVIMGIRPEHFAMDGDAPVGDDSTIEVEALLAEAMGAEVHVHAELDVAPPPIDGAMVDPDADPDASPVDRTAIIARVDGVHTVAMGQRVKLAVKTHLLHFFDPDSGVPLR
jgi:multiple sugar transport system ATP-binding protein